MEVNDVRSAAGCGVATGQWPSATRRPCATRCDGINRPSHNACMSKQSAKVCVLNQAAQQVSSRQLQRTSRVKSKRHGNPPGRTGGIAAASLKCLANRKMLCRPQSALSTAAQCSADRLSARRFGDDALSERREPTRNQEASRHAVRPPAEMQSGRKPTCRQVVSRHAVRRWKELGGNLHRT